MSAGGLNYDMLTTSRKTTLPSVEMWNTNMNILKNPPISVSTRKIDKVGDTQSILLAQDDSGDRIAEMISVYARGVNPMVSVSYDNYSNNGGANALSRRQAVKLPYKFEVFRPPVFRQEDLMPLSRQPRNYFYALTNPEMPNIINQMGCTETKSSTVKDPLRVDAPPSYQQTIETAQPVSDKKSIIEDKTTYELLSNLRGLQQNGDYRYILKNLQTASLNNDPLRFAVDSQKSGSSGALPTVPKMLDKIREEVLLLKDVLSKASRDSIDSRYYKNTTAGIAKKVNYEILTQKIQQLEKILTDTRPHKGVSESILHPNADTNASSFTRDNHENPSLVSVRDLNNVEAFTRPLPNYTLTSEVSVDSTKNIVPGERLGTWVVGNRSEGYRGQEMLYSPESMDQASNPHLYSEVGSNPSGSKPLSHEIDVAHNIREIRPMDVRTQQTRTDLQSVLHPETRDRQMVQRRPLSSLDSVNHQYANTKNLLHDSMGSGHIDHTRLHTSAQTNKSSFDKRVALGEAHLDRRVLLVQDTDTLRNTSATGNNLYEIQSRDGGGYVNQRPDIGGFHALGNAIPNAQPAPAELPAPSDWNNIKRMAYRQYNERYQ